jgi:hypothetical protein
MRSSAVSFQETPLAKPNYRHAKKQKETARKARQDAKQQRRATTAPNAPPDSGAPGATGLDEVKPSEAV